MKTIKEFAVFLAQFAGSDAPFNSLERICKWASSIGNQGLQIPTWENSSIHLDQVAGSQDYCNNKSSNKFLQIRNRRTTHSHSKSVRSCSPCV